MKTTGGAAAPRHQLARFPGRLSGLALAAGLLVSGCPALAADLPYVDPAARMQDELRRADSVAPRQPAAPAAAPATPLSLPDAPALVGTVVLNEVVFSPTELLADADLRAVARPYVGRPVTSQDLNAMLAQIQALYLARGVQTAVPVLPQQDIQSGTLRVLLVEGKLGAVTVQGGAAVDGAWVGRWFDLTSGAVIRPEELASRLNLFNAASDFGAQAAFVPGGEFGRSDLLVSVPDAAASQFWALADVPDAKASGQSSATSLIAGYRLFPLGAHGGRLDAMAIVNARATTLSLAGSLPLGQQGWRLGASASGSRSRSTFASSSAGVPDLVIEGKSSSVAMELGRFLPIGPAQLLHLTGTVARVKSASTISGETLTDRSVDRLTLAASTDMSVWQAGEVTPLTVRGAFTTAQGPVNRYRFAEISGTASYRFGGVGRPLLRAIGQARLAPHGAPDVTDAWLAGGSNSVRGFDTGAALGDRGQGLQLAVYQPVDVPGLASTEVYLFRDQARAVSNGASRRLASAGIGLQFQVNRFAAFDASLARQSTGFQGARSRLSLRASLSW